MSKFARTLFPFFCLILLQSCPSDDDGTMQDPYPEDVITELGFFIYTPQVGTTPDRLQYEITFTNPNDVGVMGFYRVTTLATFGNETIESTLLSTGNSTCYEIEANSNCVFSFDEIGDINLGSADLIEFISASYTIDSTF